MRNFANKQYNYFLKENGIRGWLKEISRDRHTTLSNLLEGAAEMVIHREPPKNEIRYGRPQIHQIHRLAESELRCVTFVKM